MYLYLQPPLAKMLFKPISLGNLEGARSSEEKKHHPPLAPSAPAAVKGLRQKWRDCDELCEVGGL